MQLILSPEQIKKKYNINIFLAQILFNRGIFTKSALDQYLDAGLNNLYSPVKIPGIADVINTIKKKAQAAKNIIIYTDNNIDGIIATKILRKAIEKISQFTHVDYILSNYFQKQENLLLQSLRKLADYVDLIIVLTYDFFNYQEIKFAQELGIEVIVLGNYGIKNPPICPQIDLKVKQGNYPFKDLTAAGVSYKVSQALLADFCYEDLELVALATILNFVPLLGENRIIVKEGLKKINSGRGNLGLKEIIKVKKEKITVDNIILDLALIFADLNSAVDVLELLTCKSPNRRKQLANKILFAKEKIQGKNNILYKQVLKKIDPNTKVINYYDPFLNFEQLKYLTYKLAITYNKATIVIGANNRIFSYLINQEVFISKCRQYLIKDIKGGLRLKKDCYQDFAQKCQEILASDLSLKLKELDFPLYQEIKKMAPFGQGNFKPYLKTTNCKISSISKGEILELKVKDDTIKKDITAVSSFSKEVLNLDYTQEVDLIYQLAVINKQGQRVIQLELKDVRQTENNY